MPTVAKALAQAQQYQAQGRLDEAIRAFREALRLKRDSTPALLGLGIALSHQGKPREAEEYFRKVLRQHPNSSEALDQLGLVLQDQGKLEEAVSSFRKAIRLQPDFAVAYNNLAGVFLKQGKLGEATLTLRKAVRVDPNHPEAHYNLGNLLQAQGGYTEAASCYREALRLRPDFALTHFNLGATLVADNQPGPAVACFREAIRLQPTLAIAHANLGHLLLQEGRREQAVESFREALRHDPACANALAAVAFYGLYPLTEPELARMRTLLADPRLDPDEVARLHFGLAHVHDRQGACDAAFAHFRQANAVRRRLFRQAGKTFDPEEHHGWVERIVATCDASFFPRVQDWGRESERPVFIVGMPRSGTTLVEQILASHPQVFGAGELTEISKLIRQMPARLGINERYPDCLRLLHPALAHELADQYVQYLQQLNATAARVTDKMPNNYQYLGLIAALFPWARVIHCRRDPMDVCFSCYVHDFKDWTCDLGTLASYYREYERLMAHWRSVLPRPLLEVDYEEMVEDPETVSRRLVSFCGLEWDDRCLAHHQNERAVRTASLMQVRQPVYKSAVGRWRRYETHLRSLWEALKAGGTNLSRRDT
jgi:tetratricopeptide (TPR) repeat protein